MVLSFICLISQEILFAISCVFYGGEGVGETDGVHQERYVLLYLREATCAEIARDL